jgi:hypothetical protein
MHNRFHVTALSVIGELHIEDLATLTTKLDYSLPTGITEVLPSSCLLGANELCRDTL